MMSSVPSFKNRICTVLIMDQDSNTYLFKNGFFQKIQFVSTLENSGLDYKLTMLDGVPTIFSEAGIDVQQLSISDDKIMSSTFAKKSTIPKKT